MPQSASKGRASIFNGEDEEEKKNRRKGKEASITSSSIIPFKRSGFCRWNWEEQRIADAPNSRVFSAAMTS